MSEPANRSESAYRTQDVVVVGTGPGGLTAALYAERNGLETTLFEKESIGGELVNRDEVRGYPGFPEGVPGTELRARMVEELDRYDPRVVLAEVESIVPGDPHTVRTNGGDYRGEAIVIATGGRPKKLGVPGEEQYLGRGLFHCATCDGPLYRDEIVGVTGGSNHAIIDALFLTEFASEVIVIEPGPKLSADEHLRDEAAAASNLSIETNTEITSINGRDDVLESVSVRDTRTNSERDERINGLYVHVGIEPNTEFLVDTVPLDENGSVEVDGKMETRVEGIFAVGDVRRHSSREIASAVGDGVVAIEAAKNVISSR